jgi:hypothetical protein
MSLWYQSLDFCLYDCGENQEERGICIVEHLSMQGPRSWWENALKKGRVDSTHASVLQDAQRALSTLKDLKFQLSFGLLVALAFINDDVDNSMDRRLGDVAARDIIEDYFSRALKVLTERPEIDWLGRMIEEKGKPFD